MKLVNEMDPAALKIEAVWLSVGISYGLILRCKNWAELFTTPQTAPKQINVEPYPAPIATQLHR